MPTPPKGPRLGGSPAHERLILANLATQLFEHGKITTTETKAKRLRPYAEKLVTKAKQGTLHARREVMKVVRDKDVVHKLFAEIGPSFETRNGGYTRIIKTAPRKGDNAPWRSSSWSARRPCSAAASRVARASANRGDRAARVAASAARRRWDRRRRRAAEDAAGPRERSDQVVEAARPRRPPRAPRPSPTGADAEAAEDAADRESASDQVVEAADRGPAEGADDESAK